MAVAVSEASARVGVGLSIMLSIICVAITCGAEGRRGRRGEEREENKTAHETTAQHMLGVN